MKLDFEIDELKDLIYEGGHGYCLSCGMEDDRYIDPDTRNAQCIHCTEDQVFGLEELVVMGEVI